MVGCSDLAFRQLCRRHGADAAFSEMLFADRIISDPEHLRTRLQTCAADRPLIVQLAANDPTIFAAAAKLVAPFADAVDLNLGCPLPAAAAGPFGAWLLDRRHWPLVGAMVSAADSAVPVPIWCKVRLLPDISETIELCQFLEASGCSLITVHARHRPADPRACTRDRTTAADLDAVRAIVSAVCIPILSNGNTQRPCDVDRNINRTGAAGVACAEGLLRNPRLFEPASCPDSGHLGPRELGNVAMEYLELAVVYPPPEMSWVRSHLMWMLGREGKGHRCRFRQECLGPFSSAQLLCAIQEAETIREFQDLIQAALLAPAAVSSGAAPVAGVGRLNRS
jgi:tRNA-dihydrouridine synthase 1